LRGDSKYYFQFAFAFAFATGMRHQEILALKWSDIDGAIATVQRCISNYRIEERVKTDFMGREVFLNGSALDAINKAQTRWAKGFVFPQPNGDYYKKPKRFRLAWIEAHEKSGVNYRPMKTTRHTRATEMLSKGVNPAKAAKQLGHDKETFLKTYADYLPEYDGGDDSLMESDFANL
jgi:integrase